MQVPGNASGRCYQAERVAVLCSFICTVKIYGLFSVSIHQCRRRGAHRLHRGPLGILNSRCGSVIQIHSVQAQGVHETR